MTQLSPSIGIGLNHAWQIPPPRPEDWVELARSLDGKLDYLSLHDPYGSDAIGFEASLLAAKLGPRLRKLALVAGVALNRVEPFHAATSIATLDYITQGRAGLLVQPASGAPQLLGTLNGYPPEHPSEQERDLLDAVQAVRLLWDSWQDDAVIRDKKRHRFLDASRLHKLQFKGRYFSIEGPSITPRPPQGQPVVMAEVNDPASLFRGVAFADALLLQSGRVPPPDFLAGARWAISQTRRNGLKLILDVAVNFGGKPVKHSAALTWTGTPDGLVAALLPWFDAGFHGVRFLPRHSLSDLGPLLKQVIPALRQGAAPAQLRPRLGLDRPANHFKMKATT